MVDHSAEENLKKFQFSKEFCDKVWDTGLCDNIEKSIMSYEEGKSPWPITYLFMPEELKGVFEKCGVDGTRLAGPGAFARTIPNEILIKIMNNNEQKRDFLDFCYKYDNNPFVCGLGKDNLLASAYKK